MSDPFTRRLDKLEEAMSTAVYTTEPSAFDKARTIAFALAKAEVEGPDGPGWAMACKIARTLGIERYLKVFGQCESQQLRIDS